MNTGNSALSSLRKPSFTSGPKIIMPRYIIWTKVCLRSAFSDFVNPSFIRFIHRNDAGLIVVELNQERYRRTYI